MAHDVFVSYSQKDKATADAVVAGLEQQGIRCWIAPRDIMAGSNWGGAIVEGITAGKAMILILSSDSNESRQVLREVERAVATDTVIIPFRIEEIQATGAMAYFLGTEHWLDALTPPVEQHIGGLAATIKALLGSQADSMPAPPLEEPATAQQASPPTDSGPSRILLWGGAAVAGLALVLGLGIWMGGSGRDTTTTTTTTTTIAPTTTTTTEALSEIDLPDGYRLSDGRHNGFVVGLPESWLPFDLTEGDIVTLLDGMSTYIDPEDIDFIRELLVSGAEIALIAFRPEGETNFNVVTVPLGPFDTIEFLEAMLPDQVAAMPGTDVVSSGRFDVKGVDGFRLISRTTYPDGVLENHNYYLLEADQAFLATFTTNVGDDTSEFERIMETFTLTG
ncbi:MAG: TIR domain-containing protein [Acidimicrobiia bacterium]|nr:TIR domain-containing protein [Acidimicrobiia bacterium]